MNKNIFDIEILLSKWRIKIVPTNDSALDGGKLWGLCIFSSKQILIGQRDIEIMKETLAHELTHAILEETLISSEDEGTDIKKYDEEFIANFMGKYNYYIYTIVNKVFNH